MKALTPRQKEILSFIQDFITNKGFSPSYREVRDHFGFSSIFSVQKHIAALQEKGALELEENRARSITLPQITSPGNHSEIELPFVGYIGLNNPIETFAKAQTISVPRFLVNDLNRTYVLRAKGDGYLEEQIAQGDLIIVEARTNPDPGDTIIATLNAGDTIIKRFYPEEKYIRLIGNSPNNRPLLVENVDLTIQGIVTGLLRLY
jgi:repressor LexA